MTTVNIRGVPVTFPFEPYDLQKTYMEKVIECLQTESNGVLESPTGTGKTLSLLCSTLAWLTIKKAQVQAQRHSALLDGDENGYLNSLKSELEKHAGTPMANAKSFFDLPKIIYASRTHTQLTQAMQELKRTAYSHMKGVVIASRDQMCIQPDIIQEENHTTKVQMCKIKVQTRNCHFYNGTEKKKDDPKIREQTVVDIEDIVKLGQTHRFCPYYMAIELKQRADIVFMPYNYILDARARKAHGIELYNSVVILDEAHNIEHICEDSASIQVKTTDISLCIDEVTEVMKLMSQESAGFDDDQPKDFTADELCILKQMLLDFEKAIDGIEIINSAEGITFEGNFIFEILGKANIRDDNAALVNNLTEKLIAFLSTAREGPFQRKGNGLQIFEGLLRIVFMSTSEDFKQKINKCYKVHIKEEEANKPSGGNTWLSKATVNSKPGCRILSYWCFSPGFGMNMLKKQGIRCIILTSGTLAPLKPLISELELDVNVRLENPHIVSSSQICVRILSKGPDMEILNSNFQNRNNPNYISSLGRSILNLSRIIPSGLLIFFPSYPVMQKCKTQWQEEGLWSSIYDQKAIFVEPKMKPAFQTAMTEYYARIKDPNYKGAIFFAVCRGKVSEGLDFADNNGRAVIVTGLPYPPLKDPRVVLKKRYLDICHAKDKEFLAGDEWYCLEASRAVNQAIGRVIRHQYDYGAILLLDSRFNGQKIKSQMPLWLRDSVKPVNEFGTVLRELRLFYRNAESTLPAPKSKPANAACSDGGCSSSGLQTNKKGYFNFPANEPDKNSGLVKIHKRDPNSPLANKSKKIKYKVVRPQSNPTSAEPSEDEVKEYIIMVKKKLSPLEFQAFVKGITAYRDTNNYDDLTQCLDGIFIDKYHLRFLLLGLSHNIKGAHKERFELYCEKMMG